MIVFYNFNEELFLSTPSARRATFSKYLWGCCVEFLSTPSARRATPPCSYAVWRWTISIHALREEGDKDDYYRVCNQGGISIHALREEGDTTTATSS